MPRWCGSCRYVTDDLFANACPRCRTPLRLSPYVGGRLARLRPESRRGWLLLAGALVLTIAAPVGYFALTSARGADETVAVGMSMNEAAWRLQPDPPARRGDRHLAREFPADTARSGVLTWVGDGRRLTVRFDQGVVSAVAATPAPAGGQPTWDVRFDD